MKVPVRAFFRMHREAQKMEARQFQELAKIQLVSKLNLKWYEWLDERYERIVNPNHSKIPDLPPQTGALKPEEAKGALIHIFSEVKKGMGYRGR